MKKSTIMFIVISVFIFTLLTVVSIYNPKFDKIVSDNFTVRGILRPNGFFRVNYTFPIETVKGYYMGTFKVTPERYESIWPSKEVEIGKGNWDNSIEIHNSIYTEKIYHKMNVDIPDVDTLRDKEIEIQLLSTIVYPKLISYGKGKGMSFENSLTTFQDSVFIELGSSSITKKEKSNYSILFKIQPVFRGILIMLLILYIASGIGALRDKMGW